MCNRYELLYNPHWALIVYLGFHETFSCCQLPSLNLSFARCTPVRSKGATSPCNPKLHDGRIVRRTVADPKSPTGYRSKIDVRFPDDDLLKKETDPAKLVRTSEALLWARDYQTQYPFIP